MGLSLLHLLEASLLIANGLAILHEKRFLKRCKLTDSSPCFHFLDSLDKPMYNEHGPKQQFATFLYFCRTYLRAPLVAVNLIVMLLEVLIG